MGAKPVSLRIKIVSVNGVGRPTDGSIALEECSSNIGHDDGEKSCHWI